MTIMLELSVHMYMYIYPVHCMYEFFNVTKFGKTTIVVHNNFEQTLTFKHSLFGHFAQQANEIWYPGRSVTAPSRDTKFHWLHV